MEQNRTEVVITDVKIPFLSLVCFFVKLAIAVIPVIIILMLLVAAWFVVIGFFEPSDMVR
jgi:hypothetical protein